MFEIPVLALFNGRLESFVSDSLLVGHYMGLRHAVMLQVFMCLPEFP